MDVRLVIFNARKQRREIRLVKLVTVIGRDESCDLVLAQEGVSRRHCEFRIDKGRVKVKDLDSGNGTYVNNKRIGEANLLAGDRLTVDGVAFTVKIDGAPEEIEPAKAPAGEDSVGRSGVGKAGRKMADEADVLSALAESHEDESARESVEALEAMSAPKKKRKRNAE